MMGPAEIHIERSPETAADRAARRAAEIISARVAESGQCHVAVSGGTTPGDMFRCLAAHPLAETVPWEKVHVFFADERDVPQDHVENNYRMVTKALLDHVPVPLAQIHPMPADCRDLAAAAEQYEDLIRRVVPPAEGDLPAFDLIHLGMGGEGHTASLFPDTPALAEHNRLVVAQFVPVIGRNRMTFTYPLINAARNVLFFVTGGDKARAIAAVTSDDTALHAGLPAARVRPAHGKLIFVLDTNAAAQTQTQKA